MLHYIVLLGAIVQLIGTYPYIRDTLRGTTKPNRVSWLLWGTAPIIATGAAFARGDRWVALPVFMAGFNCFLILFASFINSKAYWKLKIFDYLCGAFSILALVLWGITQEPVIAIVFALISDVFASLPTLLKSWRQPDTESVETYIAGLFNACTAFFVLKTMSFSELAFPIYLVVVDTALILFILRPKLIKYSRKYAQ